MKPFTEQQIRFLQEVGDSDVLVDMRVTITLYKKRNGTCIQGRGLTQTFDGLVQRGALERCMSFGRWKISERGRADLAAFLALPICPDSKCRRRVRTQTAAGDESRRLFVRHKARHGFLCHMSLQAVPEVE